MTYREQLIQLYTSKWPTLIAALKSIIEDPKYFQKPTNPLLIYLNEENYEKADVKVMILGQETNSWYEDFNSDMTFCLENYDTFFNSGYCLNSYGGHFWNGVSKFISLIHTHFPGKSTSFVWNNLIKIGNQERNRNRPPAYTYDIEKQHFTILKEEIAILQPDIVLFLSGPNYDDILADKLGQFTKSPIGQFTDRQLVKINWPGNKNTFRTYHPKPLYMYGIDNYFNAILSEINI